MYKTILFIEDEPDLRRVYKEFLEYSRYKVYDFENSVDAKPYINKIRPDLIISGIMQPKQDGIEFLKELKSVTKWKKIPFIIFTGINVPEVRIEAKALGAVKYLLKSEITPEVLVKEIDEVLQNKDVQGDKDDSLKEVIKTELHGQLMKSVKGLTT